jgi:SAM-dependent methyltransferase
MNSSLSFLFAVSISGFPCQPRYKFLYIYGMSPFEALALLQAAPAFRHPVIQPPAVDSSTNPARWADLGCGSGLFTLALASLLPAASTVYAIDRYPAIRSQLTPNQVSIQPKKADFVKQNLPTLDLDGVLMANSLHYVKDKPTLIRTLRAANLRPQHAFLIIEYDTDRPTPIWMPYPVSFTSLQTLFHTAGYSTIIHLSAHPYIYNRNAIYSAYIA